MNHRPATAARMKKPKSVALPDAEFQALVRARYWGDPQAMAELGARLVVGDGAPSAPADGAALIAEAAQQGNAEAWRQVAVLAAAGVGRPQSWPDSIEALDRAANLGEPDAIERLDRAANLGEPDAGRQLQLLRDMGIRAGSDVTAWLSPGQGRTLSAAPRFVTHERFLTPGLCAHLIARSAPRLVKAQVYDAHGGGLKTDPMRTSTGVAFSLIDTDIILQLIRARIAIAAEVAVSALEPTEILHYAVGECYRPHVDFFHPALPGFAEQMRVRGQRIKTCLVYLNDDYDGGETDFPKMGVRFRGRVGEALLFENVLPNGAGDMKTLHTGLPPSRGEKWLLSQWIRTKPQPVA